MALYHSSVAFLDSFALLTKCDTSAIKADIPARIQPNTGMDLIAAPTMRNAPASPMFATVPAVADAVCTACAAAAPVVAPTLAVLAVLLACSAAAFAVVAAVDAMVAVVSAAVAAVDAICSPRPTANKLFHHSFALFNVIRENAESLFKVCATCCNPIVIDINDWTFNIIFCKFSFSSANKATAPCAAVNPPTTPFKPDKTPANVASSFARTLPCDWMSPWMSCKRPSSFTILLYASDCSSMPLATASAISSFNARIC